MSLFGNTQCSDETGVSSFKIRPSPNIDMIVPWAQSLKWAWILTKKIYMRNFWIWSLNQRKMLISLSSLVTTFTESSKSNETRASLNSCTDASIIEHETEPETKKGLDTRTHKTNTLCLFNQPKSNKSKRLKI